MFFALEGSPKPKKNRLRHKLSAKAEQRVKWEKSNTENNCTKKETERKRDFDAYSIFFFCLPNLGRTWQETKKEQIFIPRLSVLNVWSAPTSNDAQQTIIRQNLIKEERHLRQNCSLRFRRGTKKIISRGNEGEKQSQKATWDYSISIKIVLEAEVP